MEVLIRQENASDYEKTEALIKSAFENALHASGTEWNLVKHLRQSSNFVKELSLVAVLNDELVGHILFTPVAVVASDGRTFQSLALAPVSVVPSLHGKGIGGQLIQRGHQVAQSLGYQSVILLGHPGYYPRFGYKKASLWNITAPFDVPDEAFMALELIPQALAGVSGVVQYPREFSEF